MKMSLAINLIYKNNYNYFDILFINKNNIYKSINYV